jgi:hypothetical protein
MFVQSFDDAAQFLARALPWPTAGEPDWFVNIHHSFLPPGGTRPLFPGRACTTVKEAVACVQWASTLPKADIYVCMSAQSQATQRVGKTGRPWMAAKRLAANAIWHKSLFVDVDVKEGAYASTAEAAREFQRIRREVGLPEPSIAILSGSGGFHVHWIFVEPIRGLRFLKLANSLVAALQSKGFKGDTGVSIDGARLLRIPNTLNWKHDPPKPVKVGSNSSKDYLVEALEEVLAPYEGIVTTKVTGPQTLQNMPNLLISNKFKASKLAGSDLGEGYAQTYPLSAVERVCPWVANTVATGGAQNNNPLWLASTNLSLFLDDSRAACHAMADGYVNYTQAETDALFDRQWATQQARNLGWPQCRSVHSNGAPECASCPHLAMGKSPLNFAALVQPPPGAGPGAGAGTGSHTGAGAGFTPPPPPPTALPDGYAYAVNGTAGIVCKIETDDAGTQRMVAITERPMMNGWLQENPNVLHFDTISSEGKGLTKISVPQNMIGNIEKWSGHCSDSGLFIQLQHRKEVMTFHSSWVSKLKQDRSATISTVPFGWLVEDGVRQGFVYGGQLSSPSGAKPAGKVDRALAERYTPKGTIQPYLDAMAMLMAQKRPAIDALLAVSYGSPLVALIGQTGFIMSVYSQESGIQKTSALRTNASVWGHPSMSMQTLDDTSNAVFRKAGQIRHLPIVWDEVRTGDDAQRFSDFVFQLSGGKEKARLKATTEFQSVGDWATILVGASNNSLLSAVNKANKATEAGAMRIFEYVVPKATQGIISTADATMMVSTLDDNYGVAGLMYAKFLGENFEVARDETLNRLKDYEIRYGARPEERFWFALIACLQQGATYANAVVGTSFDLKALEKFLIDTLAGMRTSKLDTTVNMRDPVNLSEMLSRYLNFQRPEHTLITDTYIAPNRKATASVKSDFSRLKETQVHVAQDGHMRLRLTAFNEWLDKQKLPSTIVLNELKLQFGAQYTKQSRLGYGTNFMTQPDQCLTLDFRHPGFPPDWAPY